MKKFNINDNIYIQITDEGWKHLEKTVGDDYIKHCIKPYKTVMGNEIWYKLQTHSVMNLLPITFGTNPPYNPNVLFEENDLIEYDI